MSNIIITVELAASHFSIPSQHVLFNSKFFSIGNNSFRPQVFNCTVSVVHFFHCRTALFSALVIRKTCGFEWPDILSSFRLSATLQMLSVAIPEEKNTKVLSFHNPYYIVVHDVIIIFLNYVNMSYSWSSLIFQKYYLLVLVCSIVRNPLSPCPSSKLSVLTSQFEYLKINENKTFRFSSR